MTRHNLKKKLISLLLIVTYTTVSFSPAFAGVSDKGSVIYDEDFKSQDLRQLGNSDGYKWMKRYQEDMNSTSVNGKAITFGNDRVNSALQSTGGSMTTDDLSVATTQPQNNAKWYTSGTPPTVEKLQGYQTATEDEIADDTNNASQTQYNDAVSDAPTVQGHVYATVNGLASMGTGSIGSSDPIFNNIKNVKNSLSGNPFSDCEIDRKIVSMTTREHTVKKASCTDEAISGCTLTHEIELAILGYPNSAANYLKCTDGRDNCVAYVVGTYPGNTLTAGSCSESTVTTTLGIANRSAIKAVTINTVKYAGAIYARILNAKKNAKESENRFLFGYNEHDFNLTGKDDPNFTCSTGAVTKTHNPNLDLTDVFLNENNTSVRFTVTTKGQGYALVEVDYDPVKAVRDDNWADDSCRASALAVSQGLASGHVSCQSYLPHADNKIFISGVTVDDSYVSSVAGLPANCSTAKVTVDKSNFNDESIVSCKSLDDAGCGYMSTSCARYSGDNQTCLLTKKIYDCGYDADVTKSTTSSTYSCPGAVQCMGTDCVNLMLGQDATADWTKAMGLMQQSQQAANDVTCTIDGEDVKNLDPNRPLSEQATVTCLFFSGKKKTCNDYSLLGMGNDCCHDSSASPDVASFIRQTLHLWKVDSVYKLVKAGDYGSIFSWDQMNSPGSVYSMGWDLFKNYTSVGKVWSKVSNSIFSPAVDLLNNIIPYAGDVLKGAEQYAEDEVVRLLVEWAAEKFQVEIMSAVAWVKDAIGLGASSGVNTQINSIFEKALSEMVGETAANNIMTTITIIGWVYAAYNVTKMLVAIWSACSNDEYELQSDMALKKCDYVGRWCSHKLPLIGCITHTESYCCNDSPLSRILNKQIKFQENGCYNLWPDADPACAYGDKKNPNCNGVTSVQMANVDWNRIDLTEWLELLQTSGAFDTEGLAQTATEYLPVGGYDSNGNRVGLEGQSGSKNQ